MGNYKKGAWDGVSEEALDTEAHLLAAEASLADFTVSDVVMDRFQEEAYRLICEAIKKASEPLTRDLLRKALASLQQAEEVEEEIAELVHGGQGGIAGARSHNHTVIAVAQENRQEAAQAQRVRSNDHG